MENNELMHHGVKGMRWGVRRTPSQLGHRIFGKKKKKIVRKDMTKPKTKTVNDEPEKTKPKTAREMTNDELRQEIGRMQLEKQFRDLYKDLNPRKVTLGERFVNKVLIPAAEEAGRNLLKDLMINSGKNAFGLSNNDQQKKKNNQQSNDQQKKNKK